MNLTYEPVFSPSNFWFGEHALLTGIMVAVLMVAFLTIALVMLWAPSMPFPNRKENSKSEQKDEEKSQGN